MVKNSKKIFLFSILGLLVAGALIFGVSQTIYPTNIQSYPAIVVSEGDVGIWGCTFSEYAPEWHGEKLLIRAYLVNDKDEYEDLFYSNWDTWRSSRNRGVNSIEYILEVGEGVKPQEDCDGNTNCEFGSNKEWVYDSDTGLCFIKQESQTYYRLSNNLCNSIDLLQSSVTGDDYLTEELCWENFIISPPIICPNGGSCDKPVVEPVPVECNDNVDCIGVCGDKSPTCVDEKCRCDDIIVIIPVEPYNNPFANIKFVVYGIGIILLGVLLYYLIRRFGDKRKRRSK